METNSLIFEKPIPIMQFNNIFKELHRKIFFFLYITKYENFKKNKNMEI